MCRIATTCFCLCLCVILFGSGCGQAPTSDKQPSAPPAGAAAAPAAAPVADDASAPAADDAIPLTPDAPADAAGQGTSSVAPDPVPPPAQPDTSGSGADAPAKLPFEDLVQAAGNAQLINIYRQTESSLVDDPNDDEMLLQRVAVLNAVAGQLISQGDRDRGMEASRTAFELLQAVLPKLPQPLPDHISGFLAAILYNGACAQALGGQPEEALATLQQAVDFGLDDLEMLKEDPDLASVRALAEFDQRLETWSKVIQQRFIEQAREVLATGKSFPFDFELTDITGQPISLASFQGKVVIVDIWGTWCPPCRAEIPSFIRLQNEFGPQGLQIVGLNYEHGQAQEQNTQTVQKFVEEFGINYPCALGTEAVRDQVPDFSGYPTTLFVDRSGRVRATIVGLHDYTFLQALIEQLLAEAAEPAASGV